MHIAGNEILKTYPVCLTVYDVDSIEFISYANGFRGIGWELSSKMISNLCDMELQMTPIDGELPGAGCYFFFKNEVDAMAFKLGWL